MVSFSYFIALYKVSQTIQPTQYHTILEQRSIDVLLQLFAENQATLTNDKEKASKCLSLAGFVGRVRSRVQDTRKPRSSWKKTQFFPVPFS